MTRFMHEIAPLICPTYVHRFRSVSMGFWQEIYRVDLSVEQEYLRKKALAEICGILSVVIIVIAPVVVAGHLFGVADVGFGEIIPLAVEALEVAGRLEGIPEPLDVDHRGLHLLLREAGLHLRIRGIFAMQQS